MDPSVGDPWQPLFDKLTQLKDSWPGEEWTWDSRFATIASSFGRELEATARASASALLPLEWTSATIATAPEGLRTLTGRAGGLRPGQLVFAGKVGTTVLYGLWWPWGGGDTITLRLGLAGIEANADPFPRVRDLFGVAIG